MPYGQIDLLAITPQQFVQFTRNFVRSDEWI